MTAHALVPQCAELRERCFELFRMQNSQNIQGLRPWNPLGRAYSVPRLPSYTTVFLFAPLVEKPAPQKTAGYSTEHNTLNSLMKTSRLVEYLM